MNETYESILNVLAYDDEIVGKGGVASLTVNGPRRADHKCNLADFPIRIYPLGTSQTASAGELKPNGYFAVTVTMKALERMNKRSGDFLAIGERIVALLHRSRHGGQTVVFSKNIIAHSSFVLENSNRRINVKIEDEEIVQVLFFWTNAATAEALAAASATTTARASSLGMSAASAGTTTPTANESADAVNAVTMAAELFP